MNISMKKLLFVLLVFMMSLGLVACQKDNDIEKDLDTYLISFDTDGGDEIKPVELKEGDIIDLSDEPSKVGHTFISWDQTLPEVMPNHDINLKALWETNHYTVSFDTDGGTSMADVTQPYLSELSITSIPEKLGHRFVKWDKELPTHMPLNGLTLKAIWEKIEENIEDSYHTEDFEELQVIKDGGGNFSSYEDFDYISVKGFTYDVLNGRIDIGLKANGNAITIGGFGNDLGDAGLGFIELTNGVDGISEVSFKARLPFSPKSTYPQGGGSDKANNARIKVFVNDTLIETFSFLDDDEANKGKTFMLSNLNVSGDFTFRIEISSGHRLTVDDIIFKTNLSGQTEHKTTSVDFESELFDFDNEETIHELNGMQFVLKEVHTLVMHQEKEMNYMSDSNGSVVARFRGDKDDYFSTPVSYMYNVDPFSYVRMLSFDARLFGSEVYFSYDSIINIYINVTDEFILLDSIDLLTTDFKTYTFDINQSNVIIKIEVLNGKVNLDNIIYII